MALVHNVSKLIFISLILPFSQCDEEEGELNPMNRKERRMQFNIRSCEESEGRCMSSVECNIRGGRVGERCLTGLPFLHCCKTEPSCGGTTSAKVAYFKSDPKPKGQCTLHIKPTNRRICQLRLDFEEFSLSQPRVETGSTKSYACLNDTFSIITNSDSSLRLPALCGENAGQHMYIPVKPTTIDTVIATLAFQISSEPMTSDTSTPTAMSAGSRSEERKWKLKIQQLECGPSQSGKKDHRELLLSNDLRKNEFYFWRSDVTAPAGCTQYFTDKEGVYESFNYNNGMGPYIGDMKYSICFHKNMSACGIRHTIEQFRMNSNGNSSGGTERDCDTAAADATTGRVEDYLFIPDGRTSTGVLASKYCDSSLNSNDSVTSTIPGPVYVAVSTGNQLNAAENLTGFRIRYEILTEGC